MTKDTTEHLAAAGVLYLMLEARGLTKFYSAIPAVRDLSFTLCPGGVLGLLGPNGSGKSTTVSILTGLLEQSGGSVMLDGSDIRNGILEYKAKIGYVPEDAVLYSYLTGPEHLSLIGHLRGSTITRSASASTGSCASSACRMTSTHRCPRTQRGCARRF